MVKIKLSELKKGDFFKLSENGAVLVRGDYDRGSKTYSCYYYEDVNHERFIKGSRVVLTGFTY